MKRLYDKFYKKCRKNRTTKKLNKRRELTDAPVADDILGGEIVEGNGIR